MNGYGSRPLDGGPGDTSFEQELVSALNDFANNSPAPHFDATGIQRRARRKRAGLIAGVAAAVAVAGGGTALAAITTGSPNTSSTAAASSTDATTVMISGKKIDMTGWDSGSAKAALVQVGLKLGTVTEKAVPDCKPTSVLGVSPHSPHSVSPGDTVNLTVCSRSSVPDTDATTVMISGKKIDMTGWDSGSAKAALVQVGLKLGTVTEKAVPDCKPTSVLGVSPHSPHSVSPGDTVNLTICTR
ncbi:MULTISPECIES: PASTA domain-containing protein [unclassified Streptomyces]|uniref:PASTA domain-containing protein n=3 Tax=Streptomyces TaxID=1883 RepID=UPI00093B973D|nr:MULTISPECIES: PASTA domain-containing protein [unclassified Streptomyces]